MHEFTHLGWAKVCSVFVHSSSYQYSSSSRSMRCLYAVHRVLRNVDGYIVSRNIPNITVEGACSIIGVSWEIEIIRDTDRLFARVYTEPLYRTGPRTRAAGPTRLIYIKFRPVTVRSGTGSTRCGPAL